MRWTFKQGALKVDEFRSVLDELILADVIWRPLMTHRQELSFDDICLNSVSSMM